MSPFAKSLRHNQFCILVEYLANTAEHTPPIQQLAGFPCYMTLADRVQSDDDRAPIEAAQQYPQNVDKVLHYAGKGRDIADFRKFLDQAHQSKYHNLLLLTGDKLKQHQYGDPDHPEQRTRYLESVNAVMEAKQHGGFCIGVAFNPYKYVKAEKDAQYLKLHKKIKAGADYIITQLGYDLNALKQAQSFLQTHQYSNHLLACVMPLTLARAKFMLKHQVAGIVITPHMIDVLEREKQDNLQHQVYMRCALQILICKNLGLAGVHLSACHKYDEQKQLERYIQAYQHLDLSSCEALWHELWQIKTEQEFEPEIQEYAQTPSRLAVLKYQQMNVMHDLMFDSKLAKGVGGFIFKSKMWNKGFASKALLKSEFLSKHHVMGCESCGQCRIADTLYICPETCPKGLANGPCGGTSLDLCEFGDRECIHSVKARLAEAVNANEILKTELIPTVPIEVRGTSSWKNWYLKD